MTIARLTRELEEAQEELRARVAQVKRLTRERDEARVAAAKALTWTGMEDALRENDRLRALLRDIYRRLSAASATEASELETDWNQAIQACLLLMDEAALEA